eukprot:scaffold11352_cov114-Isochrysis_galbana.AAC.1
MSLPRLQKGRLWSGADGYGLGRSAVPPSYLRFLTEKGRADVWYSGQVSRVAHVAAVPVLEERERERVESARRSRGSHCIAYVKRAMRISGYSERGHPSPIALHVARRCQLSAYL